MTWVVKGWRMEGLEQLLAEEARVSARAACEAADRDARRARRAADRAAADAAARLEALERLGAERRATVRRTRTRPTVPPPPGAVPPPLPADEPAPPPPVAHGARRRPARASMHSSALSELFRATTAR
jgi:hypothetical protein